MATAGGPREKVVSEALSAISAAAEPVSGPGVVSRLIGPRAELRFIDADIVQASTGGTARQVLRFGGFGDYSVHYLARRS